MKPYFACVLMLAIMATQRVAYAEEYVDYPVRATNPNDTTIPADIDPEEMADLNKARQIYQSMAKDTVCADLSARPTPLPNGDFQYPVVPCKALNITAPLGAAVREGQRAKQPVVQVPPRVPQQLQPIDGQGSAVQAMDNVDFNTLQMKRLGTLDAMQGRPLNMNHASNLGYVQGYTEGQQRRMMPQGGGFGGFNR